MFKMTLFAITLTVTVKKKKMTMQEYEDMKRIKLLKEDILNKRLEMTHHL